MKVPITIVMEGSDHCGKSTQTARLIKSLESDGYRVAYVKSPHNDLATHRLIYWMLFNGWARRIPNMFQLLQFMNKLFFQLFSLPGLLKTHDYIVFDRWGLSMHSYGISDGASSLLTRLLMKLIIDPDLTLILDRESREKANADSYESDRGYQRRVRKMYLDWAFTHRHDVEVIDASLTKDEVSLEILARINSHFARMEKRTCHKKISTQN